MYNWKKQHWKYNYTDRKFNALSFPFINHELLVVLTMFKYPGTAYMNTVRTSDKSWVTCSPSFPLQSNKIWHSKLNVNTMSIQLHVYDIPFSSQLLLSWQNLIIVVTILLPMSQPSILLINRKFAIILNRNRINSQLIGSTIKNCYQSSNQFHRMA